MEQETKRSFFVDRWGDIDPVRVGIAVVGALVLVTVVLSVMPFTIVSVGERVIVTRNGAINRTLAEGFHMVTPLIENTITMDVSTQKEEVDANAASKDLQNVTARIAVNYNLDPEHVDAIYSAFKTQVNDRLIAPSVQEAVKAATARYTAEELVTKREAVRTDILNNLKDRLTVNNILVSGVNIVNFEFSPQFNQAIESKVKAEQDALTQKNLLAKVQYEAEQKIATARAEAESIRLQSNAADNDKYIKLKELEVRTKMAEKWNGVLPVNMYAGAPIPLLDINK